MIRIYHYALFLLFTSLLGSCVKDMDDSGEPSLPFTVNPGGCNEWIYSVMSKQYLYNDYIETLKPDFTLSQEEFFNSLLSKREGDNDGKHTSQYDYFYSFMLSIEASKAGVGRESTYGLEVRYYYTDKLRKNVCARVVYVIPGSPAARAGLTRMDWITKINGAALTLADMSLLECGATVELTVDRYKQTVVNGTSEYVLSAARTVKLGAAEQINVSPVLLDSVYCIGGRKIGYVVYNQFETGPAGMGDTEYDCLLRDVFVNFRNDGVKDLILDLRYNPGGYFVCCQKLSSMIVPSASLGELFCIQTYNKTINTERKNYLLDASDVADCNLNLPRLYVLTSSWTASSSELLINCLRPYMDVRVVGTVTEGKNVGSIEFRSGTYHISLHPIVSKAWNSKRESNYEKGIQPDIEADDELNYVNIKELGDTSELLLQTALADITGTKSCPMASKVVVESPLEVCPESRPLMARHEGLIFDVRQE